MERELNAQFPNKNGSPSLVGNIMEIEQNHLSINGQFQMYHHIVYLYLIVSEHVNEPAGVCKLPNCSHTNSIHILSPLML